MRSGLSDITGWWGEETGHVLTGYPFCWVVDPNDGTSDFLRGLAGSTIPVGLLHDGKSVIGEDGTPVQYTTEATMAKV